jgi:hypothetical protein
MELPKHLVAPFLFAADVHRCVQGQISGLKRQKVKAPPDKRLARLPQRQGAVLTMHDPLAHSQVNPIELLTVKSKKSDCRWGYNRRRADIAVRQVFTIKVSNPVEVWVLIPFRLSIFGVDSPKIQVATSINQILLNHLRVVSQRFITKALAILKIPMPHRTCLLVLVIRKQQSVHRHQSMCQYLSPNMGVSQVPNIALCVYAFERETLSFAVNV